MDKDEIKRVIVECREAGMSFQAIADYLEDNYGVIRSRQSIQGMYNRCVDKEIREKRKGNMYQRVISNNIVQLYTRGYSNSEIIDALEKNGHEVKVSDINKVLNTKKNEIKKIRDSMINRATETFYVGRSIGELRESLRYNGMDIKEKEFEKICLSGFKQNLAKLMDKIILDIDKEDEDGAENIRAVIKSYINGYKREALSKW